MDTRRGQIQRVRRNQALSGPHANKLIEAVNAIGSDAIPDMGEIVGRNDDHRILVRITEGAEPQEGFVRAYGGVRINLSTTGLLLEANPSLYMAHDDIPLYERSGNSHVPIDGTALVWATPADYGNYLLFDWTERTRWALITGAVGTAYSFEEQFPDASNSWANLPDGVTGTPLQNPLRDINGRVGVPAGTRVRFWRGFSSGAAHVQIQRVRLGDGTTNSEQQSLAIIGATDGTFTLSFEGEETDPLDFDCSDTDLETALEDLTDVTDVIVTGTGTAMDPFIIEFADDVEPRDILQSDGSLLKGDQEWLFDAGGHLQSARTEVELDDDEDDYALDISSGTVFLTTDGGDYDLTGIAGGAAGQFYTLVNAGPGTISLPHQTGSSAANQFTTPDGATLEIPPGYSAYAVWSPSEGNFVITAGTAYALAAGGGGSGVVEPILTGSVSNGAAANVGPLTGGMHYRIVFWDVTAKNSGGSQPWIRVSTDGGSTYDAGGSDYTAEGGADSKFSLGVTFEDDTTANSNGSIELMLYAPGDTSRYHMMRAEAQTLTELPIILVNNSNTGGARMSTTAITHVRLMMATGNINAKWRVYAFN